MVLGLGPGELGTLTTAVVGIAGLAASGITRRGDRKHDVTLRELERTAGRLEDRRRQREEAYLDALAHGERLVQQMSSQIVTTHDEVPAPLPAEDWLRLRARLEAFGSKEVRAAFGALADARLSFDVEVSRAATAHESQQALIARLGATEPTAEDLRTLLEHVRASTTARPERAVPVQPEDRPAVEEQLRVWRDERIRASQRAGAIYDGLWEQIQRLREVIRSELRLPT